MNISTDKFINMLVETLVEEPYFSKEIVIPKIKALIKGFRLSLSSPNYHKKENPTQTARLIRSNEIMNMEKIFWKQQLEEKIGTDAMSEFYEKLRVLNDKMEK